MTITSPPKNYGSMMLERSHKRRTLMLEAIGKLRRLPGASGAAELLNEVVRLDGEMETLIEARLIRLETRMAGILEGLDYG